MNSEVCQRKIESSVHRLIGPSDGKSSDKRRLPSDAQNAKSGGGKAGSERSFADALDDSAKGNGTRRSGGEHPEPTPREPHSPTSVIGGFR